MSTPNSHPDIPMEDSWPDVELKRLPNGEMGVLLDFPSPPALKAFTDVDVIGFNIEPKRALRLRNQLNEMIDVLGLGGLDPERYSKSPVDRLALSDLRAQLEVEKTARKMVESQRDKLDAFKTYVHQRLDEAGVPNDPEPEENAKHGCRVEGRLNFVIATSTSQDHVQVRDCYAWLLEGMHPGFQYNAEAAARMRSSMMSQPLLVHFKVAANTVKSQQERIEELEKQLAMLSP